MELDLQGFAQFPQSFPQIKSEKNVSFPQLLWKSLLKNLHNKYHFRLKKYKSDLHSK